MKPGLFLKAIILISFCFGFTNVDSQKKILFAPVLKPLSSDDSSALAKECKQRREVLGQKLNNGVLVISNSEKTRNNFFYLSGWIGEPAYCFIDFDKENQLTLLIPDSNPQSVIWNGQQPGKPEAQKLGALALQYFDYKKKLKELANSKRNIYMFTQDQPLKDVLKSIVNPDSSKVIFVDSIVHEMRVVKSRYEVENIKKAISVTSNALINSLRTTKPGLYEYEITSLFNFEYSRNGLKEAFPSICGSGINSTALHYERNNRLMLSGDVLLMDVGAKYNGYAADITRTIPVNGKFSKEQLDLYKLVLKAQKEGIQLMKPGNKILDFHNKCSEIISRGLFELGFITDTTRAWQKEIFILYQSGHYLGLDVHDVGRYDTNPGFRQSKRGRDLLPGMVITIEPGIYINPEMLKFIYAIFGNRVSKTELDAYVAKVKPTFEKYANIGIRIEDDILITEKGNEILSAAVPKQPEDIERLMNKK